MPCLSTYSTPASYEAFWCLETFTAAQIAQVTITLELVASNVNAMLAATGSCSCTWADWVAAFLSKLSIIEAAIVHKCHCGRARLTDADRAMYLNWLNTTYENIRSGKIVVCQGATAIDYPAGGWAEHAWTEWNAARILEKLNV